MVRTRTIKYNSYLYRLTSLKSAFLFSEICRVMDTVMSFPTHAFLPLSTLSASAEACILGTIWQGNILANRDLASREWINLSNHSVQDALHVFGNCHDSISAQRRHAIIQQLYGWLQSRNHDDCSKGGSTLLSC